MKKLLLLPVFVIFMSFSQCDKSKLEKDAPAKVSKAIFQDWSGGKGSRGTLVTITLDKPTDAIVFDSIYFQGNVEKLSAETTKKHILLKGNFITSTFPKRDLILSSDPKEEFGNTPPPVKAKITFELENNEAIISFKKGDKTKYFLVKNIKKEKTILHQ